MQRQIDALMASKSGMTKKQRSADSLKKTPAPCGTMAYIAESRGTLQRADSSWRPRPLLRQHIQDHQEKPCREINPAGFLYHL